MNLLGKILHIEPPARFKLKFKKDIEKSFFILIFFQHFSALLDYFS